MAVKAGTAFFQVVIFAYLFDAYEIGVIAMLMTVINTVKLISDMGVSSALISFDDPTKEELNSLFWFNVFFGALLTSLLFFMAPFVADFYNAEILNGLIYISSFYFLIWSIAQQSRVIAEKNLSLATLAKIEILSYVLGFLVTNIMAYWNYGVVSVAIGFVVTGIVNSILCLIRLPFGAPLELNFKFSQIKKYIYFGVVSMATNVINTLTIQSDVVVVGRIFGPTVLGVYAQPRDLCLKLMFAINPVITRVTFPLLAAQRADRDRVYKSYLSILSVIVSINFPIFAFISLFSYDLVDLIFGEKWASSAPLMQIFAVWCAFRSIGNPTGSLLLAMGRPRRALATASFVSILLTSLCIGASWYGAYGVSVMLAVTYAGLIPYFFYAVVRPVCGGNIKSYMLSIAKPALATVISVIVGEWAAVWGSSALERVVFGGAVGGTVYVIATYVFNRSVFHFGLRFIR